MKTVYVSVSGGRTSAYMAWWMINNQPAVEAFIGDAVRYKFCFMNTGMEHEDTLRFIDDVDRRMLDGKLIWLESVPMFGQRKASGYRIVSYETAYGLHDYEEPDHPFHATIKKYGVPNTSFIGCTRELKLSPFRAYMEDTDNGRQITAVGIREDEKRRVVKTAEADRIIYPLVDLNPVDKQDVLDFWTQYDWDLKIPEWQGNCVTCYKKSYKKLAAVYHETPEVFEFTRYMEKHYGFIGPEFKKHGITEPRVFFRQKMSTDKLIKTFEITGSDNKYINTLRDAGCSESCEMYEMEHQP